MGLRALRSSSSRAGRASAQHPWPVASWMLLAIAVVTSLAWWDAQREADATLQDLEAEQTVVAVSLGASLQARLRTVERDAVLVGEHGVPSAGTRYDPAVVRAANAPRAVASDPSRIVLTIPIGDGRDVDLGVSVGELLDHDRRIERSGEVTVFLSPPREVSLRAMDGDAIESPPLRDALDHGLSALRLGRPEAAQLGLPARTAVAGLAHVDTRELGRWGVAAVASAGRERDREKRARWRLVLSVGVASGLVLAFGGMALRKQREELELARELAISEVQRTADEGLARAQRLATMGTFAMGIAHEVATPLGVIMGRSEQMIARPEGDGRTARAAQVISEQADRIEHIVRRFLDMARGGPPTLVRADPGDVARAAAAAVEHRFAKAGVALNRSIPAGMPAIQCERALLEQAIVNLLLNACEACGEGGHAELSALAGGERVEFVVTDDGAGISAEDAKRATEPFFTTKASRGGTGLGLAIATEIAKIHRGALSIGPDSEGRTRACIEVPAAGVEAEPKG